VHPRNALTCVGCADKRTAGRQAAEVGERLLRFSSRDQAGTSTGGSQTWCIDTKSPGLCQDDALLTGNEATDRPRVGRCCQDSPPGYSRVGDFLALAPSLPQAGRKKYPMNRLQSSLEQAAASRERQALREIKKQKRKQQKKALKAKRKAEIAQCLGTQQKNRTTNKKVTRPASNEFLESFAWRKLRMEALKKYGATCQCCGASRKTGAVINVDHIKPRKLFPSLALDLNNLQVLCHECNHGKGNWDMTDWR